MRYEPCEYLPYTTKDPRPGAFSVGWEWMEAYRDVIGKTRAHHCIMEYYRWKGKPAMLRMPKRYKHQRN